MISQEYVTLDGYTVWRDTDRAVLLRHIATASM
jgi:hypothetical protein